jgi:Trk K+ transport system NAD-binding subunit
MDMARRRAFRPPRLRPHDTGTTLMLVGLCGIATILLMDWLWLVAGLGRAPAPAFLDAARVVATVGPAPQDSVNTWYSIFAAAAMLVTIVLTALFTAGIVERLLGSRMLAVFGPRSAPRSGHVIVVGLGQVGIRLCVELRRMGVPVIGVERDTAAPNLRIARSLRIAAVVGHGADRKLLDDLGLRRSRALAAVGSDDMDNIAIAVAAHGVSPGTRVVLRAGEQEATAETRALLPLGIIRDITSSSAAYVIALLRGAAQANPATISMAQYAHAAEQSAAGQAPCPHI